MGRKIPALKAKEVIKALLRAGFYVHHQRGSHVQFRHDIEIHLRVTIPAHNRFDLPPFVINSILKQADLNEASTGLRPWYPSFLRRNPPKHPPSLFELRRVQPSHSSSGLRPRSSAKADKDEFLELLDQ